MNQSLLVTHTELPAEAADPQAPHCPDDCYGGMVIVVDSACRQLNAGYLKMTLARYISFPVQDS